MPFVVLALLFLSDWLYACSMCLSADEAKEVGYLNVPPVKLRQSRMKAMSTSEPPANQGILTVVSTN